MMGNVKARGFPNELKMLSVKGEREREKNVPTDDRMKEQQERRQIEMK